MTRLIGGLLVATLLYSPVKYQVKHFISKAECADSESDNNIGVTSGDIECAFIELDDNTRQISALINEKNMLFNKIETELDLRSHLHIELNERQINGFSVFMDCYNREMVNIRRNLKKIDERKSLCQAQRAILNNSSNYGLIYNEINAINKYQNDAIDGILRVIDSGNDMLMTL